MKEDGKIKAIIVENGENDLIDIERHLANIQEIELVGTATKYGQARNLLTELSFDLLLVCVEISGKSVFELLKEIRPRKDPGFCTIIFADDKKHTIRALRESVFDFILKPIQSNEFRMAIKRYLSTKGSVQNNYHRETPSRNSMPSEVISLPTSVGLQFVDKSRIAVFMCAVGAREKKPTWSAMLTDQNCIKLRSGITAKGIIAFMGGSQFLQLNQSTIINIHFVSHIEFSSRACFLHPPFSQETCIISKANFAEIRDRFDRL